MDEVLKLWNAYPALSLLIAVLGTLLLMYLLRHHAHAIIHRVARLCYRQLRLLAQACMRAEMKIRLRNHELNKVLAEELMQRRLELEFIRIEKMVARDLDNYQELAAAINKQLSSIDDDYQESALVPPASPEWIAAVEAIAALKEDDRNTEVMGKILSDMHATVEQHQRDVMREHRWSVNARHKLLANLRPRWRKLTRLLEMIHGKVEALHHRLQLVDQQMTRYELLTAGVGKDLMSSVLMRFVTSLAFVLVGVVAAYINFHLLLEPLNSLLAEAQVVDVSLAGLIAITHILVSLVAAAMIFESMRTTHFFPLMSATTQKGRVAMVLLGVIILAALVMAEALLLSGLLLPQSTEASAQVSQWVLAALGMVLPLLLALLIIPLEYLLHTVRPVLGGVVQLALRMTATALRMLGAMSMELGRLLVQCYDLLIFIPLRIESDRRTSRKNSANSKVSEAGHKHGEENNADSAAVAVEEKAGEEPPGPEPGNITTLAFDASRKRPQ